MKVKVSHLLTSFAAVILIAFSTKAQEEIPVLETSDPEHRELNLDEDKTLIYDHPSHTSIARDTIMLVPRTTSLQPAKSLKPEPGKNARKEGGEGDDALSFNFLYYMIQKFKMSDLIDQ